MIADLLEERNEIDAAILALQAITGVRRKRGRPPTTAFLQRRNLVGFADCPSTAGFDVDTEIDVLDLLVFSIDRSERNDFNNANWRIGFKVVCLGLRTKDRRAVLLLSLV